MLPLFTIPACLTPGGGSAAAAEAADADDAFGAANVGAAAAAWCEFEKDCLAVVHAGLGLGVVTLTTGGRAAYSGGCGPLPAER